MQPKSRVARFASYVLLLALLVSSLPVVPPAARAAAATPATAIRDYPLPQGPEALLEPFVDPIRAALEPALGPEADPLFGAGSAPARLEPLAAPVLTGPVVTIPTPPNPSSALLDAATAPRAAFEALRNQRSVDDMPTAQTLSADPPVGAVPSLPATTTTNALAELLGPPVAHASDPQAPRPLPVAPANTANTVYLPLVRGSGSGRVPSSDTVLVQPDAAAFLRSSDGRLELQIPAGAVSRVTTITYRSLPAQTVHGYQHADVFFQLTAEDDLGTVVRQFARPLTLRVGYVAQPALREDRLRLHFYDETLQQWVALPTTVQRAQQQLIASTDHFTLFAPLSTSLDSCADVNWPGLPSNLQPLFVQACQRIGIGNLGDPIGSPNLLGSVWVQRFANGSIVSRPDPLAAFYMAEPLATAYRNASASVRAAVGAPIADSTTTAPATFHDEYHDFRDQPFIALENGFVGQNANSGNTRVHYPFPEFSTVSITSVWEKRTDEDGQTINEAKLTLAAEVDPAPGIAGVTSAAKLFVTFNDGTIWEAQQVTQAGTVEFTYGQLLPITSTFSFHWALHRSAFSADDDLIGYAPCLYYDHEQTYGGTVVEGSTPINVSCEGGSSGSGDFVPPTIRFVEAWPDGQGNLSIKVEIVDNSGVIADASIAGGPGRLEPALILTPEFGPNIYSAVFKGVPPGQIVNFTVTASDPSGNTATTLGSSRLTFRSRNGLHCTDPCFGYEVGVGNPVLPGLGNKVETLPVVFVAGSGEADIDLTLTYNAQDPTIGLTGQGWSFPYQASATRRDNLLLQGYEVIYPDGRQVLFAEAADGSFTSRPPDIHDRLELRGTTLVLTTKQLLEYEFDQAGRLITQRDRNGNALRFGYSGDQLTSITNDAGRTVTLSYNAQGLISTITAPEGKQFRFTYAGVLLVAFTDARGNDTIFTYQEQYLGTLLDVDGQPYEATDAYLASVRTPEGHLKNEQTYDTRGRVIEQEVGGRERRTFVYDDEARTTTITDALGNVTVYHYDELYRLVQIAYADGTSEFFSYDDDFNRTSFTDRLGRVYTYTYDERGNRLSETGPLGWSRAWAFNDLDQVTQFTDAEGRITRYGYDERGNLISITNAAGDTSTLNYDARGLPIEVTDFNGNQTINSYHATTGDLLSSTNGAGDQVQFSYDGLGRLRTTTNGRGFTSSYTFDGNDNLLQLDGPLGFTLRYAYDKNDNLIAATDANGQVTRFGYDQAEQVIKTITPLGFTTSYGYDAMGNLVRVEDAEGRVWTFAYDAVYNQIAEHGPEQSHTFFRYDAVGNLTALIRCNSPLQEESCAVQQVQELVYDDLNRVVTAIANAVPGAPASADTNVTTQFGYDRVGNLITLTDANGTSTRFGYDLLDRLVREETAAAQVTRYAYDAMGNLVRLTNPRGFSTNFDYDAANRLASVTDALQQTTRFGYDANSNLVTQTDPDGIVTAYRYNALDRLEALVQNERPGEAASSTQNVTTRFDYDLAGNLRFVYDPRGSYVTEHQYDADLRRVRMRDAEGGVTSFAYDRVNNLIVVTDANGHTTTSDYDGRNRLVRITNPEGHAVSFGYDQLDNLIRLTDARGFTSTYAYDGLDRVIRFTDNLGGVWGYQYDPVGNLLAETDANGHTTSFAYDLVYRLLSRTDAEGYVTSWSYDANNNPLTRTDGNGHTSSSAYDALDRVATRTNAENETTAYAYDWQGNLRTMTEADGIVTGYEYDPLYRLSSVTFNQRPGQPASVEVNVTTRYSYDEVGNLVLIRDANGNPTSFSFDGLNRLTREVDALGNAWAYAYDKTFNRIERIDALRNRTTYRYYADDQLQRVDYHDGTFVAYTYDENNNVLTVANELGTITRSYDGLNRLLTEQDVHGRPTAFGYDAVGNRVSLTYPDGRIVRSSYLKNNWLAGTTDPEGRITRYVRDGIGQVVRQENPNSTVTIQRYDKANRLLSIENRQLGGANTVNSRFVYRYDEVGQRVTMEATYAWRNPSVVTSRYSYDPLRRLVRDEDSQGIWADYTFDAVGNRLTLTTNDSSTTNRPFDRKTLHYSYNAINQLLSVVGDTHPGSPGLKRAENSAQALHAFRHEVAAQRGKGISEAAANDLLARADALLAQLYGRPTPSVAAVDSALNSLRSQVESYQANGALRNQGIATSLLAKLRLAGEANNGASGELQTVTYRYDANGNRINKEFPGPQGPRMQGSDYRYDPENRLVVVQDYQQNMQGNRVDRAVTTMAHDGNGRRVVKSYDPKTGGGGLKRVEYVYDGLDPIAEYNSWNPQYDNFYRGDRGRILQLHHFPSGTQGQVFWYHYDGLGSVAGLTKHQGQSSHNYRYEPYGQIELPKGNFTDPHNHYTFTGQEWNEHTGLYEFYARHYDPDTGTWMSQDPYRGQIGDPRSLHRYGYVYNNPVNYWDVYGYIPVVAVFGVIAVGAVVGAVANVGARYVGDVVENLQEGKTSWDILKPRSELHEYGASAIGGAVGGGVAAGLALIPSMAPFAPYIGGGLSGALEKASESWLVGKQPDPWEVLQEAAISGVTAGVGGKVVNKIFPKSVTGPYTKTFMKYFTSKRGFRQYYEEGVDFIVSGSGEIITKILMLDEDMMINNKKC